MVEGLRCKVSCTVHLRIEPSDHDLSEELLRLSPRNDTIKALVIPEPLRRKNGLGGGDE